jgi:hypothetical protein
MLRKNLRNGMPSFRNGSHCVLLARIASPFTIAILPNIHLPMGASILLATKLVQNISQIEVRMRLAGRPLGMR